MFEDILSTLRCPVTRDKLFLSIISKKKKLLSGIETEIVWEGILYGREQWFYPIINGVPRLIVEAFIDYENFLRKYVVDYYSRKYCLTKNYSQLLSSALGKNRHNKISFEQEWKLYDYDSDKTWNLNVTKLLQQFLDETNETKESLKENFILDVGCGNGYLNILLAEAGICNVAVDISLSVVRAFYRNSNHNVTFLQGDLFYSPVEYSKFDIVYSSGVLVATHNTELAFSSIEPCVKQRGKLCVWLYHPRKNFIHNLFNFIRIVSSKLPLRFQYYLYMFTLLPIGFVIKRIKGNKQNIREQMIEILDWFSPEYRWEHEPSEVSSWYHKNNYKNIIVTTKNIFGFSIIGTKI